MSTASRNPGTDETLTVKYEDVQAIEKKLQELRASGEMTSRGPMSRAIEYLEQLLKADQPREMRAVLYSLMVDEAVRLGNRQLAIQYLRRQSQDFADEPWSLTKLAETLVNDAERAEANR